MLIKIARAGRDQVIAFAAAELKRCLNLMDPTVEVCVLSFPAYNAALTDVLWLGVCPDVEARVADPALDDGFIAHIRAGRGSIRGANGRSVLMGVYRVLSALGCAWVRPGKGGEIIPARSLADFDIELDGFPSYRHRALCIEGAVSADHVLDTIDWLPKVGMNGYFNQFHNPLCFYDRWYRHTKNPTLAPESMTSPEIAGLRDQSVEELKKRGMLYHAAGHGWTCEPFGIPGETWEHYSAPLTEEQHGWMAEVNGKRDLWHGTPLNTQMCYSNPVVREKMVSSIVEYARDNAVDCLHVWLADGTNNHCECENCRKKQPADWYVTLLNEIDAALTAAGLSTRIVFLVYVDLLWAPVEEKLLNQDRFILMFAPITRSYSESIADAPDFDEADLPAFELNRLKFPANVGENIAWLRQWQKDFQGDSFDFDYHFMWDHHRDPGYYRMAEILFRDVQNLSKIGLNGFVSCQNQRTFFPSGLGMHAMAAGLWDKNLTFDDMAARYFTDAFGPNGVVARGYLAAISDAFDPRYLRLQLPIVDEMAAARFSSVPELLDRHAVIIAANASCEALHPVQRQSWAHLMRHAEVCRLMARGFELVARGDFDTGCAVLGDACAWARLHETELAGVWDVMEFQVVIEGFVHHIKNVLQK